MRRTICLLLRSGSVLLMRISELVTPHPYAPYHLINAALNVQGSDYAKWRGRNADFFLFSPCYIGSEATGYCETRLIKIPICMSVLTSPPQWRYLGGSVAG